VKHLWDASTLSRSQCRLPGKPTTVEQRYYLVSLNRDVQRFAQSVRSHWGIENQLHWVLDVAFDEDASRIRKDHAPENLALIRHVALNLLRQDTSTKVGIKAKRLKARWNNDYLARVLYPWVCVSPAYSYRANADVCSWFWD
jgi:hypothetical protein